MIKDIYEVGYLIINKKIGDYTLIFRNGSETIAKETKLMKECFDKQIEAMAEKKMQPYTLR